MKNVIYVLTFCCCVVVMVGCDEVEDPYQEGRPPMITIDFDATESKTQTKDLYDSLNAEYLRLRDERDSIRDGSGNPADSVSIIEEMEGLYPVVDSLNNLNMLFQRSQVRIDSLIGIGGNYIEEYQDTINSSFALPLNMNEDSAAYVLRFHQIIDTLIFKYRREISTGLEVVSVVAVEVSASNSNDKVEISRHTCKDENCRSGEITYKIYF